MILFLVIPLLLGWILARYWLGLKHWQALVSVGISLGIVATLVGVNFCYRSMSLSSSVSLTFCAQAVLIAFLWWRRPRDPEAIHSFPRWVNGSLFILSLTVLVYTNAQQISNADDDYWIHAPLQGLMRHGNFPPTNPFFSDIPMNGHYGRNLTIATFSYISGVDVFMSQHLLTSTLQLLTLWLFFSAFLHSSKSNLTALFGSVFVFFGINAGGRGGLIDTMQNNNAVVHLYLALLLFLVTTVWSEKSKSSVWLAGLTLGSYAIVYETHFGLVVLSILGLTPLLLWRGFIDRQKALAALAVIAISTPLALTQGGPLTDILDRKLHGRTHTQAESLSKGMQNQAQVVKITFPKKELFQILLETGEYQRTSNIYRLDTPLKFLFKPSTERGYAYIWSWDVLKIHFLPLFLLPWSAFVVLRRGCLAGLFMGTFGIISYLVPAMVHFGPIYESEYYRWEFAASLGFAATLGMALGSVLSGSSGRPFLISGNKLILEPAGKRYLLAAFIVLVNSWACLDLVGRRFAESIGPNLKTWLVFPDTRDWLASHPVLNFDRLDFEASQWLSSQVKPGDRLLTNFQDENNFSILFESTLTGMTGARCVGHALPLEDEKIGTTPFRRSPAAQLFWKTKRPEPLAQLKVDWIYFQGDGVVTPPDFPGAKLVHTFKDGTRRRFVYSVDQEELPRFQKELEDSKKIVPASLAELNEGLRGGQIYELEIEAKTEPSQIYQGTVVVSTVRKSDGLISSPGENLKLNIDQASTDSGQLSIPLPFVAPYDEGEYDLRAQFLPTASTAALEIEPTSFRSEFKKELESVQILSVKLQDGSESADGHLPARTLYRTSVELRLPATLPRSQKVLACWAFYSEERDEFDLLPGINLREIELSETLNELPLVTPERPGAYRLALYLSAGQGHLIRIPAGSTQLIGARQ